MADRITIKDVAKECGVSITTVSFVLNNKADNLPASTKNRVLEACEKLNFSRNQNASSLKSRTTKLIGLIVPDLSNTYYSRLASILSDELLKLGYSLLTAQSSNDEETELDLIKSMDARQVDGLIFVPSSSPLLEKNIRRFEETLKHFESKIVVLDRKTPLSFLDEVLNDDKYGAMLAVQFLIDRGYKNIACITGPNNVSSSNDRLDGYKEALAKNNIKFDESLIFEGNYRFDKAKNIAAKILKMNDVDSIFAFNDISAYAVYEACENVNKKVGVDIGVVGYDDNTFSSLISPKLTTVGQDIVEICKKVVEILFRKGNEPATYLIKPALKERSSTK